MVIVSWVVKVFDETMNSVRAGSRPAQRVGDIGAVDIRDEMAAQVGGSVRGQRPRRHRRPEVGAADADIDDIGHRLPERAAQAPLAHVVGEGGDPGALGENLGHHVLALDHNRRAGEIAQRGVQRGAALGRIDRDRRETSPRASTLDIGRLGERLQTGERRAGDALLGIIEQQIVQHDMHRRKTRGVGGEGVGDLMRQHFAAMGGERVRGPL